MIEARQLWRFGLMALLAAAGFAVLVERLISLHLGPNESLHQRVREARGLTQTILVGRGRILDARGNILAMDLTMNDVCADPSTIVSNGWAGFISGHLARLLTMPTNVVRGLIDRPDAARRRYVRVKEHVPDDLCQEIRQLKLAPSVWFEPVSVRNYPHDRLMSHIVGFSNLEGVGSAGVEQRFDAHLKGVPGLRISERDGRRTELLTRRQLEIPPQAGADVQLTLDMNLQHIVETQLDIAAAEHRARGIWAAVQRVRTGEILALASRPDYDLNQYRVSQEEQRRNRAISYVYEPGSTFKMTVVAAALNEGLTDPEQVFDCERGTWIFRGRPLRDFHPYDRLSVADIIKKSSNIGAAKIALLLGEARLEKYLREFGFGRPTGIELPGEEGGIFRPHRSWTPISITRIAMGHEVGVTALQLLNAACALGNDGFLMRPAIVRRVSDPRGRTLREFQPVVLARPVREETARAMLRLLARVTEKGGTGTKAALPDYTVAGKTGTAQKPVAGGYSHDLNIASFVGVLPADNPQIGLIVVVDEPQPLHTGGAVAAPVFRAIAEQAVRYLEISPSGRTTVVEVNEPATYEELEEAPRDAGIPL